MNLHDTTIAQIVKLIQVAFLTGTDIVDHLRMLTMKNEDNKLFLDDEYEKVFNKTIEKMTENANSISNDSKED